MVSLRLNFAHHTLRSRECPTLYVKNINEALPVWYRLSWSMEEDNSFFQVPQGSSLEVCPLIAGHYQTLESPLTPSENGMFAEGIFLLSDFKA